MRPCPVCTHANVQEINRRLLAGESATQVAQDNGVAHRAVLNHETTHIPATLRRGAAATRISEAKDLFEELGRRYERFGGMETKLEKMLDQITTICRQFERNKDVARLIAVLREQRDTIRELRETGRAALEVLKLLAIARGIAEPPEPYRQPQAPEALAQAVRDLYGMTELPALDTEQRALPPAPPDAAPAEPEGQTVEKPNPQPPEPVESAKDHYCRTRTGPTGVRVTHDPQADEKIRRAKPVQDPRYQKLLDQAHAEGRRLEVGEASPHMLGTDVDYSRPEPQALPPVPEAAFRGGEVAKCADCDWEFLLSNPATYREHWLAKHLKGVIQ